MGYQDTDAWRRGQAKADEYLEAAIPREEERISYLEAKEAVGSLDHFERVELRYKRAALKAMKENRGQAPQ